MPSFDNKEVHQFWQEQPDPLAYKAIAFMESVEHWTLTEDQELEKTLANLGDKLDQIGYVDIQEDEEFIKFINQLKIGRVLILMEYLNTAYPGITTKILNFAKNNSISDNDSFGIFLKRQVIFERLRLLGRIFSQERLAMILKTLGDKNHV